MASEARQFGPQNRAAIVAVLRQTGTGGDLARLAGLDARSKEGKAFVRSVERFAAGELGRGARQQHGRMSEKNLALIERAALRAGGTAQVKIRAEIARPKQAPIAREVNQPVPLHRLIRADTPARVAQRAAEELPVPKRYLATRAAGGGDVDESAARERAEEGADEDAPPEGQEYAADLVAVSYRR